MALELTEREAPLPTKRRSRVRQVAGQNSPLILAVIMLVGSVLLYGVLFYRQLEILPGSFEITSITNNAMPLVLAAAGQTFVVLTRGIDLSVGGMINLTNALAAAQMQDTPGSMLTWTLVILLVGAVGGLCNGLLVTVGRLQPILVTLATLAIFQGAAIRVLPSPGGVIPSGYTRILANPFAPTSLIFIVLLVIAWLLFRRSRLGVTIYAVGNDPKAARARGINVSRATMWAYVLSGICAAMAGLFLAATTTGGDATAGNVYTLSSIAAVVLGGVSFLGGRGSMIGSIAGAFVLAIVVNILFFAGINPLYQSFYQGLFLVLAVILSALLGRRLGASS